MSLQIDNSTQDASIGGSEKIPAADGTSPVHVTTGQIKNYVIDQIEAISAGSSVSGSTQIFINDGGVLKPIDIDVITQYVYDDLYGKTAETSADGADVMLIKDGSTEKTLTLANLAEYVRATVESAILDISDLTEVSSIADSDYYLVTQSSTGKKFTHADLKTSIFAGFLAHVTALTAVTTPADADELWLNQGGTAYKVALSQIKDYINSTLFGEGTAGNLAKWSDTDTLEAGETVVTSFGVGSDNAVPTSKAVRDEMDEIINDAPAMEDAIADTDTVLIDDGANGTQKKSTFTLIWTWILTKLAAITDVSSYSWVLDEDNMASDDATKVPSQQSVKAYVDANGFDGNINTIDIDGGTDIGADLADADLIIVDDGANGTNRKSAVSRLWTYVVSKIQGLSSKTTPVAADIIILQDSEDSDNLKEATLTNFMKGLPAVVGDSGSGGTKGAVPAPGAGDAAADKYLKADGTWTVPPVAAGWDGDIADADIDGGTDIGEALEGTDLIIVDNGANGTNRKSAVSRIKTYMETTVTYKNLYIPASAMVPCTTNGAAPGTNEYGTNDIELDYMAFDGGATEERVQFAMPMPEDWDRGTVKAKFFWGSASGSSVSDTVEWGIKAGALSNDDAIDTALGTPQVISDALLAADGADAQLSGATPAVTIAGTPALGDLVVFEFYRNTDGTDDMTEDAWLLGVWLQYGADKEVSQW